MAEKREPPKEKDIGQIVRYLTSTFNQVTKGQEPAFRPKEKGPNTQYLREREFAYRINELVLGPRSMQQKNIADCNNYIDTVMQEINKASA
jgi:hypothetical protein